MDPYAFGYSQWDQHNTTLTHEYAPYSLGVPPVPIEPVYIEPGPPPYNAHQPQPLVQLTTTAGSAPRRTLTDDDRRRMREYHDSHPGVKQTEIGAMFGVERSTVSKVLRRRKELFGSNDRSQSPTKEAKGKFPDIERALVNWAKNEQIKGELPNDFKLQEQAQRFAVTVGDHESLSKVASSTWLKEFKEKYNVIAEPGALVKSEGQDESTPRMSDHSTATPVSDSAIESLTAINPGHTMIHSARPTSMQPPPMLPLPRSENTSPVSSGSPTQDDARRALILVLRYFRSQPAGFLEPDECAVVGKLTAKLFSSISEGTAVLPGGVDESLNPSIPKKRKIEAMNDRTSYERLTCSTGFAVDGGYSACGDVAAELVSHVY